MITLKKILDILSRLSKREKTVLYAAVTIVSLLIIDRLVIYPITSRLRSLDEEIQQRRLDIKKGLRMSLQKERILEESEKYKNLSLSSGSEEEETTALLKEIETLANKASVYILDMKPAGTKISTSSKKYLVSLNCEAQMSELVNFMYQIEGSNRMLGVERYEITPKSRETSIARASLMISRITLP